MQQIHKGKFMPILNSAVALKRACFTCVCRRLGVCVDVYELCAAADRWIMPALFVVLSCY